MNIEFILQQIDIEIDRLQQVRSLLSGLSASSNPTTKTSTLSPEARKRIAAAQKKRWAAVKAKKGTRS